MPSARSAGADWIGARPTGRRSAASNTDGITSAAAPDLILPRHLIYKDNSRRRMRAPLHCGRGSISTRRHGDFGGSGTVALSWPAEVRATQLITVTEMQGDGAVCRKIRTVRDNLGGP